MGFGPFYKLELPLNGLRYVTHLIATCFTTFLLDASYLRANTMTSDNIKHSYFMYTLNIPYYYT